MEYDCARCHHRWAHDGDDAPETCPNCHAEAGLEPHKATPFAMKAFGVTLGGAALLAFVLTGVSLAGM